VPQRQGGSRNVSGPGRRGHGRSPREIESRLVSRRKRRVGLEVRLLGAEARLLGGENRHLGVEGRHRVVEVVVFGRGKRRSRLDEWLAGRRTTLPGPGTSTEETGMQHLETRTEGRARLRETGERRSATSKPLVGTSERNSWTRTRRRPLRGCLYPMGLSFSVFWVSSVFSEGARGRSRRGPHA
jgi:hypothetical protein